MIDSKGLIPESSYLMKAQQTENTMQDEIALLTLKLANAKDALYFAKLDHEREMAELKVQQANDQAHIVECHKEIIKLRGATS